MRGVWPGQLSPGSTDSPAARSTRSAAVLPAGAQVCRAVSPWRRATSSDIEDPIVRDGRPQRIAAHPLEPRAIARGHHDARIEIEAAAGGVTRAARRRPLFGLRPRATRQRGLDDFLYRIAARIRRDRLRSDVRASNAKPGTRTRPASWSLPAADGGLYSAAERVLIRQTVRRVCDPKDLSRGRKCP
jgi:hypothetical protein